LAASENVIEMAAVVDTEVAPDAGDDDTTENVPAGGVVTGVDLLPDEHPVISAVRKVSDARVSLKLFNL